MEFQKSETVSVHRTNMSFFLKFLLICLAKFTQSTPSPTSIYDGYILGTITECGSTFSGQNLSVEGNYGMLEIDLSTNITDVIFSSCGTIWIDFYYCNEDDDCFGVATDCGNDVGSQLHIDYENLPNSFSRTDIMYMEIISSDPGPYQVSVFCSDTLPTKSPTTEPQKTTLSETTLPETTLPESTGIIIVGTVNGANQCGIMIGVGFVMVVFSWMY
eukprot:101711_1